MTMAMSVMDVISRMMLVSPKTARRKSAKSPKSADCSSSPASTLCVPPRPLRWKMGVRYQVLGFSQIAEEGLSADFKDYADLDKQIRSIEGPKLLSPPPA